MTDPTSTDAASPAPSTPSRRTRPERVRMSGRERREQLVDVGRKLFAEKGFEAVTIEEIASKAGVSKPVVYEHFGSKDGLYAVIVDREMNILLGSISDSLTARAPRALLEQATRALFDYIVLDIYYVLGAGAASKTLVYVSLFGLGIFSQRHNIDRNAEYLLQCFC